MQKLDLTKWLKMVWDAVSEQDEVERDRLLLAADMFLREEDQDQQEAA